MIWDQTTIGYLAGVVEADGAITSGGQVRKDGTKKPLIKVGMVDEEIVRHLQEITGIGSVCGPYKYKNRPNNQDQWMWTVAVQKDVARLLCAISPLLGSRKREIALDAANRIRSYGSTTEVRSK